MSAPAALAPDAMKVATEAVQAYGGYGFVKVGACWMTRSFKVGAAGAGGERCAGLTL